MSNIRRELVNAAYDRAYSLIQNDDMHKRFASLNQFILDDESLTIDEFGQTEKLPSTSQISVVKASRIRIAIKESIRR